MPQTDLYDAARELLNVAEICLDSPPPAPPPQGYAGWAGLGVVHECAPPRDCCPYLAAWPDLATQLPVIQQTTGGPIQNMRSCALGPWQAIISLEFGVCTPCPQGQPPNIQLPSGPDIDASALLVHTLGWRLWQCLNAAIIRGSLFPEQAGSAGCRSVGPLQGVCWHEACCAGYRYQFQVEFDGELIPTPFPL